jgi:excisionase family DNA binding protein
MNGASMFTTRTEQTVQPMLLTGKQAAKVLSISERTLFTLTKAGTIPVVKIGERGIRYDPADLRAWIESAKSAKCPVDKMSTTK